MTAVLTKKSTTRDTFVLAPMAIAGIDAVRAVEKKCFPTPWPRESFRYELERNHMARYFVLRRKHPEGSTPPVEPQPGILRRLLGGTRTFGQDSIVGFAGIWMMVDEAHITTLAVDPEFRGQGLGELLLVATTELSGVEGAKMMTLEVRQSNAVAQRLYEKYGFSRHGIRRHYYSDDGEDAVVMWSEEINSPPFQKSFRELRAKLRKRLTWESKL